MGWWGLGVTRICLAIFILFLFKFYNNILGLNVRVSKFNQLIDPSCTFCSNRNFRPAERESFAHLFYYCETTHAILTEFLKRYFTINVPGISVFFCGTVSNKERENRAFQLTLDVFRYHIWVNKLEKNTCTLKHFIGNKWQLRKYIWGLQNFKTRHWLL